MNSKNARPMVGIGVIVEREGKVLLGERIHSHGSGTFCLPGGHLEFGETFEETTIREIQEETGLTDIKIEGLISVANDIAYDKHYVSIGMLATWISGEPYAAEPEKTVNWKWYDPKNLPSNVFIPSRRVIENWLEGKVYNPLSKP